MQHACNIHVTCAGVRVCSMCAVQQGSRYIYSMYAVCMYCSMYAVYMPNMCMKVADIYRIAGNFSGYKLSRIKGEASFRDSYFHDH